ncbi:hypothetical protein GJAV_G00210650 [Gymnothorax javanicus]|nr:hypothetical protein GJAV_G00210650 [Gymnothorax javanicus]
MLQGNLKYMENKASFSAFWELGVVLREEVCYLHLLESLGGLDGFRNSSRCGLQRRGRENDSSRSSHCFADLESKILRISTENVDRIALH